MKRYSIKAISEMTDQQIRSLYSTDKHELSNILKQAEVYARVRRDRAMDVYNREVRAGNDPILPKTYASWGDNPKGKGKYKSWLEVPLDGVVYEQNRDGTYNRIYVGKEDNTSDKYTYKQFLRDDKRLSMITRFLNSKLSTVTGMKRYMVEFKKRIEYKFPAWKITGTFIKEFWRIAQLTKNISTQEIKYKSELTSVSVDMQRAIYEAMEYYREVKNTVPTVYEEETENDIYAQLIYNHIRKSYDKSYIAKSIEDNNKQNDANKRNSTYRSMIPREGYHNK